MADFEVANYPDDSTPFCAKLDSKSIAEELEISSLILFPWLRNSYMKANTDRGHLSLSGDKNLTAKIDGSVIEEDQVLHGIPIDFNLSPNY